jgi:hypothetical protein
MFSHQNSLYSSALHIYATCPAHLILLDKMTQTVIINYYYDVGFLLRFWRLVACISLQSFRFDAGRLWFMWWKNWHRNKVSPNILTSPVSATAGNALYISSCTFYCYQDKWAKPGKIKKFLFGNQTLLVTEVPPQNYTTVIWLEGKNVLVDQWICRFCGF